MARKSDGEKIDELTVLCTRLEESMKNLAKQLEEVDNAHSKAAEDFADLRREYEKEIALLKKEIEDSNKWRDEQKKEAEERGRRLWAFGPNLLAAIIGLVGIVISLAGSLAIAYFMRR